MTTNAAPVFEAVVPVISVDNLQSALAYYKDILGFKVAWTWGEPPYLAGVCRDSVEINLGQKGKSGPPHASQLYFQITGVEAYYRHVKSVGANITVPLDTRPYGMRDFGLHDLSGNDLHFGEPTTK